MSGIDTAAGLAFQNRMAGNQLSVLEDPKLLGVVLDLEGPAAGGVGHGIEVAADRDHSLLAHPPFDRQHGAVGDRRKRLQAGLLLGEGRVYHPSGRGMDPGIGDLGPPGFELGIEIVDVAEPSRRRDPGGYSGRVARPCPWFWPDTVGRPAAPRRSGSATQRARRCRSPPPACSSSPITAVFIRS